MKEINKKTIFSNLWMITWIVVAIGAASAIFGSNNTLIWVAVLVGGMMFYKMDIGMGVKQAVLTILGLFILIGISNQIAMINPFLGIIVNFVSIFLITYIPSKIVQAKPYMPFVLCYIFGQSNPALGNDFKTRIISLILGGVLLGIIYYIGNRKTKCKKIKIKEEIKNIDIKSDRFILSIKMALGITIAMFIGDIIGLTKTMWIALSVMSITQIDFNLTKEKFKHRIFSTILGSIIFVILFKYLIPEHLTVIATLFLSYIYTFVKDYHIQIVFITVNALSSAMVLFDSKTAVWLRIILVITGCLIGYAINRMDFRNILKNNDKVLKEK